MDFFLLKKWVSLFLHLVPGCLLLLVLAMLLKYTRLYRLANPLGLIALLILLLASIPAVSNKVIYSLEDQFPLMATPPADTTLLVTLGNFASNEADYPANARLHAVALSRITETIRLWKQHQSANLFFGGPSRFAMRDFAIDNGVLQEHITIDHHVRDSIGEISAAMKLSSSAGLDGRTVIVSSATHLPRAKLIVDQAVALGLTNQPVRPHSYAPADFLAAVSERTFTANSSYLHKSDRVLHEYVGMLWIKLRVLLGIVLSE